MSRFGTRIGIGLKRAIGFLHSRLDRLIERMGLNLPVALKRPFHIFTDEDAVVDGKMHCFAFNRQKEIAPTFFQ